MYQLFRIKMKLLGQSMNICLPFVREMPLEKIKISILFRCALVRDRQLHILFGRDHRELPDYEFGRAGAEILSVKLRKHLLIPVIAHPAVQILIYLYRDGSICPSVRVACPLLCESL